MNYSIERITGDNARPGMPATGFLVRYNYGKFGWKCQRCFESEFDALMFGKKLDIQELVTNCTMQELRSMYFDLFEWDNRIPDLFDLIEEDKLKEYILDEICWEFSMDEIRESFNNINNKSN